MKNDRCRDCGVSIRVDDKDEKPSCPGCKAGTTLQASLAKSPLPAIANLDLPLGSTLAWLPQTSQSRLSVLASTLSWALSSKDATAEQAAGARATSAVVAARDASRAYDQMRQGLLSPDVAAALRQGLRVFAPGATTPAPGPCEGTATPGQTAPGRDAPGGRLADAVAAMGEVMFNGGVTWAFTMEEVKATMVARGFTQAEADEAEAKVWKGARAVDLNSAADERTIDSLDELEAGQGTAHKVSVDADVMAMLDRDSKGFSMQAATEEAKAGPEPRDGPDGRPPEGPPRARPEAAPSRPVDGATEAFKALLPVVGCRDLRDCDRDALRTTLNTAGFTHVEFEAAHARLLALHVEHLGNDPSRAATGRPGHAEAVDPPSGEKVRAVASEPLDRHLVPNATSGKRKGGDDD